MNITTLETKSEEKIETQGLSKESTSQHIYDAWLISATIVLFVLMTLLINQ